MSSWEGLEVHSEGTGISRPLSENVNLFGDMLGAAIAARYGAPMLALVEELRLLCKQAEQENDPAKRDRAGERVRTLDLPRLVALLRAFTSFFHLVNQAEKQEIIRLNRERARQGGMESARPESVGQAMAELAQAGVPLGRVHDLLARLDIQPTLTAHPTEARRRTILDKQHRLATLLARIRRTEPTPEEEQTLLDAIYGEILILLATDEIRARRPEVRDEVGQGVHFLAGVIWETIPRIHQDMRRALARHYNADSVVPVFLRYRSWIGGDRDGNPNVTAAVTGWTFRLHRRTALRRHIRELQILRKELSLSARQVRVPQELAAALARDAERWPLAPQEQRALRSEPFRRMVAHMLRKLHALLDEADTPDAGTYDAVAFIADLELVERALVASGFAHVAERGHLPRALVLARTFGFHLAALDLRQHSDVHARAVAALLAAAGTEADYEALDESRRCQLLERELRKPTPLTGAPVDLPEDVAELLATFRVVHDQLAREPESVGAWIVSMTHSVSDLLEPMLLAKQAGLWSMGNGAVRSSLDFVPLFETIDDLAAAAERMSALFENDLYRAQLQARGGLQEVMLGYSDSNKDGGYWMANQALHDAQQALGALARRAGVEVRLFHGRGGTVSRGGGRANRAILAMPRAAHSPRIRFTEQGEVISFRYGLPDIARRHLEQVVSAVMRSAASGLSVIVPSTAAMPAGADLMRAIAQRSMTAYRRLVNHEQFFDWFARVTPIEHISRLPIASRPVARGSSARLALEQLRAIPWVFAWTQPRYNVPGWYGTGAALGEILQEDAPAIDQLRALYQEWPFFRAVVDNAQLEMARARMPLAEVYHRQLSGGDIENFHTRIAQDYHLACSAILRITGQQALLDNDPVIQRSIELRNPYTDVLNLVQIELLRRCRDAEDSTEQEELRHAIFLSINGIAAAMQSTG